MIFTEPGGKSIVIYTDDDSYNAATNIMSVLVDDSFFADILKLVEQKNKVRSMVSQFDGTSEFLRLVAGDDCKCQCMCCSKTVNTPPTKTVTRTTPTTKQSTTKIVTRTTPTTKQSTTKIVTRTTPTTKQSTTKVVTQTKTPPMTTKMTTKTTPPTKTYTSKMITKSTTKTLPISTTKRFMATQYLPVPTPEFTGTRKKTTTRTYKIGTFKQYYTIGVGPAWISPSRRSTSSRMRTTSRLYEKQKPLIKFEY